MMTVAVSSMAEGRNGFWCKQCGEPCWLAGERDFYPFCMVCVEEDLAPWRVADKKVYRSSLDFDDDDVSLFIGDYDGIRGEWWFQQRKRRCYGRQAE